MSVAVIISVYSNDSPLFFEEAVASIPAAVRGESVNVYLHVDGPIGDALNDSLKKFNFYKIIKSPTNIGLAAGLNKLIASLGDEWLVFRMDADDVNLEARFQGQYDFMVSNPGVDILGGNILEFLGSPANIVFKKRYPCGDFAIKKKIFKSSPFAHVTVCFRRAFFDKVGLYPVEYPLNEDIAYWFKALKSGVTMANLPIYCVCVRMDGAYGRRGYAKSLNELKVFFKGCRENNVFPFYPVVRFAFRMMPSALVRLIYKSRLRSVFS